MSARYDDGIVRLLHGDCIERMRELPAASVDAVVTDPPYGLSFMGKDWDHGVPGVPFWQEILRVAKPGAHLLAFGGTRTVHRIATAIEDAGWEIRDMLVWGYASGFPKSRDISKDIDRLAGAERAVVGSLKAPGLAVTNVEQGAQGRTKYEFDRLSPEPSTDDAKRWQGWGTALKPAWEPIVLARKPLAGTVARNMLTHGTGALNIDATRIPLQGDESYTINTFDNGAKPFGGAVGEPYTSRTVNGRDGEATADKRYTEEGSTNFAAKPGRRIKNPTLARYAAGHSEAAKKALGATVAAESESGFSGEIAPVGDPSLGRWPPNLLLTDPIFDGDYPDEVVGGGSSKSGDSEGFEGEHTSKVYGKFAHNQINPDVVYADAGGKSRFFQIPRGATAICERCGVSIATPNLQPRSERTAFVPSPALISPAGMPEKSTDLDTPETSRGMSTTTDSAAMNSPQEASTAITESLTNRSPEVKQDATPRTASAKSMAAESGVIDTTTITPSRWMCGTCAEATTSPITSNSNVSSGLPDPHPWAFLVPKAGREERERGLEELPLAPAGMANESGRRLPDTRERDQHERPQRANNHPTVKPLELMRHLVRLVTPRGGLVLDPFVGSGTTALACSEEGFRCIGIDQDAHYLDIAEGRLQATPIGLGLTA